MFSFLFFFPFAECIHSTEGFCFKKKKKRKRQQTFMAPSCQKPQNAWGCLSSCKCWSHFPVVYVLINQVSGSSQSISLSISQERHFGVSKVTQPTYPGFIQCKGLSWPLLPLKVFILTWLNSESGIEVISTDWTSVCLNIVAKKKQSLRPIKIK